MILDFERKLIMLVRHSLKVSYVHCEGAKQIISKFPCYRWQPSDCLSGPHPGVGVLGPAAEA